MPPIVFAALILVFVRGKNDSAAAYPIYLMSAYCLIIWVVPVPRLIKRIKSAVIERLSQISVGEKYITVISSIIGLTACRKLGSPILSAATVLNFVAALMSFLGLQTAMMAQFSKGQGTFRRTMNTVLGTAVWCAVVAIALLMLHSTKTRNEVDSLEQIRK